MSLLLIIAIPLLNVVALNSKAASHVARFSPIIFLAVLLAIFSKNSKENILQIVNFNQEIIFGFIINKSNIKQLFLLDFIWLIFAFYIERFSHINNQNLAQKRMSFAFLIMLINMIIIAQNLITMLFFYNILALGHYFFFNKFFIKNHNQQTKIASVLILCEPLFLLCAIIFTIYFGGHLFFSTTAIFDKLNFIQSAILFLFYLGAILSTIFIPVFLFYHKNYIFDSINHYLILMLFYAFPKIYIFTKLIAQIFGFGIFSHLITKIGFWPFSLIFAINLAILAYFMLFSRDFKAIFFYVFWTQFIFSFFEIFVFAFFDDDKIYAILPNFILALSLVFLAFSNLILYLRRAENKDSAGLFYDMKITISLLVFGFINLIGLAPTNMMAQKFSLAKIIFHEDSFALTAIFVGNILVLTLFSCKLFFPMLTKVDSLRSENDKKLAAKIDSSSSLILTSLSVAAMMVLLPILQFFL